MMWKGRAAAVVVSLEGGFQGKTGVDPPVWTPEYWGWQAPDEESTCREADRPTRPNFTRKRLN
jgi:hypothetical protein